MLPWALSTLALLAGASGLHAQSSFLPAVTVDAPYAGGQVANGGGLGLLGNRGIVNTPFNQTSYTAKLIQNQQARTIDDVLANDPSVRVVSTAGGGQNVYFIRGFYYDPGDLALNGLYGLAPAGFRAVPEQAGRGRRQGQFRAHHDNSEPFPNYATEPPVGFISRALARFRHSNSLASKSTVALSTMSSAKSRLICACHYSSTYNGVVALGAPRTYLVSTTFNF